MSTCKRCGQSFHCAMADGKQNDTEPPCWCTTLPPIPAAALAAAVPADAGSAGTADSTCFCPDCLARIARDAGIERR